MYNVKPNIEHPVKCKRPIAAELVNISIATGIVLVLLGSVLIFGWLRSPLRLKPMLILDVDF